MTPGAADSPNAPTERAGAKEGMRRTIRVGAWPEFALAHRFATANRRRLIVTLVGAALAVALMIYQSFLIVGFIRSATAVADGLDADLWVVAHEAQAFDFSAPMRRDLVHGLRGMAWVAAAEPVLTGFATAIRADGKPVVTAIAGIPMTRFRPDASTPARLADEPHAPHYALVDVTGLDAFVSDNRLPPLEGAPLPLSLEINGARVLVTGTMRGYATFLGSPFMTTNIENATRWLNAAPDVATGVAVWLAPGADLMATRSAIREAYPELMVQSRRDYARRSAIFWLTRTGAGAGLLLSALLGFAIGLLIISQNLYASVLESLHQYTTLRAVGFAAGTLSKVVIAQSIMIALAAGVVGSLAAYVLAAATRAFILGWIATPIWVPLVAMLFCVLMGLAACISASRLIHRVEPAHALRQF
jgi:putative ABC transport system permease protein